MGGMIDWSAIGLLVNMLGIDDVERFVYALAARRDQIARIVAAKR